MIALSKAMGGAGMSAVSDTLSAAALSGNWGSLRPLDKDRDSGPLFELTHGAERDQIWREMKVGPFASVRAFADHAAELTEDRQRAFFTVMDPGDRPLGWLCLMEASMAHRSVELGYVLYSPPLQRTTLASEAYYLVMSHVFETLGFDRLEWTCTASNIKSRRAADRLGFEFEGVMRRKLVLKGQPMDIAMYSLLSDAWPGRREAMRNWLAPSNFVNGAQVKPLEQRPEASARV